MVNSNNKLCLTQFQIPVTIPIMAEPPPSAKPPSFLRPIFPDEQDGPVPTYSKIPEAAGQQQPEKEEELTSPPAHVNTSYL